MRLKVNSSRKPRLNPFKSSFVKVLIFLSMEQDYHKGNCLYRALEQVVYSFGKLRESLVSGSVNVDNSQKIQASELSGIHLGDAFLRFYAESFDKPPVLLL